MIADAVKSRGRSRHGHLTGAAMTAAVASGRQQTPTACSGREVTIAHLLAAADREAESAWLEIRSAPDISGEGEHPALGPVPLPVPPGEVSRLPFREPQNRVCRSSEPSAGDLVSGDDAFLFQFANQLVNLLGQPPFGPDGGVQILPSFRTTREPIQYPVAQRTKIRLRLDQELL